MAGVFITGTAIGGKGRTINRVQTAGDASSRLFGANLEALKQSTLIHQTVVVGREKVIQIRDDLIFHCVNARQHV